MNRRFEDSFLGKLLKLWPLIFTIAGMVSAFAVMENNIKGHSKSLETNLADHKKMEERITRVEDAVLMIPEMRSDIKILLQKK